MIAKIVNKGFSLVELLVVVALMGIIGSLVSQIFILGIRSSIKSELNKEVKQNGDFALSVMESMIRNASSVSTQCGSNANNITIVSSDGGSTTFDCSGSKIASVSSALSSDLTASSVLISSCTFRVVCPTPPTRPKYVYINYNVAQAFSSNNQPDEQASQTYQRIVSLRNYD